MVVRIVKKKDKNDLLYCFAPNKKKLSSCNENIQYGCFKKLRCGIKRKLKFNGANSCIHPSYLTVCFTNFWNEFIFMKRIKLPRAESCDVMWRHHCLHKKLAKPCILWLSVHPPKIGLGDTWTCQEQYLPLSYWNLGT